jgi:hypothetical protein
MSEIVPPLAFIVTFYNLVRAYLLVFLKLVVFQTHFSAPMCLVATVA